MAEGKQNLVALRAERERCVDMLSEAFATDLLDVDEFERRVDLAHTADTVHALVSLREDIRGLDTSEAPKEALVATYDAETQEALALAQAPTGWCVGIMGAAERKGQWRVPKRLRVATIMGGASLDFREAILAPGVSSVHVVACMGGIEVIVPPNLAVECNGIGIMGGFESMERCPAVPDPSRPLLRITGLTMMGGIEITTRLVGESAREARKRRKRERQARKKALASVDRK